jgi:2-oxoglutarate ferredoxin oxidoreductase subunit gamma
MNAAEVLFAGFGGHGMLLSGKLLAQAAMETGRHVSWLPAYGPEMRGGTANVTVCVSNREVGSPYIEQPGVLVVMNGPSLDKFEPRVKPGGLIVVNTSLVSRPCRRSDCITIGIDAQEVAVNAGTIRAANLVMLGALVGWSGIVPDEVMIRTIENEFSAKPRFVGSNVAAYRAGFVRGLAQQVQGESHAACM